MGSGHDVFRVLGLFFPPWRWFQRWGSVKRSKIASDGTRPGDLWFTSTLLYHLSYPASRALEKKRWDLLIVFHSETAWLICFRALCSGNSQPPPLSLSLSFSHPISVVCVWFCKHYLQLLVYIDSTQEIHSTVIADLALLAHRKRLSKFIMRWLSQLPCARTDKPQQQRS